MPSCPKLLQVSTISTQPAFVNADKVIYMKGVGLFIVNTLRLKSCKKATYNMKYDFYTKTVHTDLITIFRHMQMTRF